MTHWAGILVLGRGLMSHSENVKFHQADRRREGYNMNYIDVYQYMQHWLLMYQRLFVCLGFSSKSRIFHSHGDVTITEEGLHILTYARHPWPLNGVGSLLWYGALIYIGHLRGPVTLTPTLERFAVELSLPVFTTWVWRGLELPFVARTL